MNEHSQTWPDKASDKIEPLLYWPVSVTEESHSVFIRLSGLLLLVLWTPFALLLFPILLALMFASVIVETYRGSVKP